MNDQDNQASHDELVAMIEKAWHAAYNAEGGPDYIWVRSMRTVRWYKGRRYVHLTDQFTAIINSMKKCGRKC